MIKGVLFDMDGLITDTERLLSRFWIQAAAEYGFEMRSEHTLGIRSLAAKYASPHLQKIFGSGFDYDMIRDRRRQLMNEYIEKNGIEKKKGLDQLLDYIGKSGLKCAVCTATDLERTKRYLSDIGVYDKFDKFVCGDMIENGKPQPDTYIAGANALKLRPEECAALEDSPNGILSAYSAGCVPIMIPDLSQPDEKTRSMVCAVCGDLSEVIPLLEQMRRQ